MASTNPNEDGQISPSRCQHSWEGQDRVTELEVRDHVEGTGVNFRLGEVIVHSRLGEPVGMRIERTGVLF